MLPAHPAPHLTIAQLDRDKIAVVFPQGDASLLAYREFVAYFANVNRLTDHHVVIGAHFTYGWMPTILDLHLPQARIPQATAILNAAKAGARITVQELTLLKNLINNSLVGSSKLLHFVNPEYYAIWDSRVCRYLGREARGADRITEPDDYFAYLDLCQRLADHPDFPPIRTFVERQLGYPVSAFRAIELIMFMNGAPPPRAH